MGSQRKLNALLFELQTARSPLQQAKTMARAWRTIRELSPTDRKLLARHAGFSGAEEMLEGLATKRGWLAPAALLGALSKARDHDGTSVSAVVAGLRNPEQRVETLARGLGAAADIFLDDGDSESNDTDAELELASALDELQSVQVQVDETPEEAQASLTAIEIPEQQTSDEDGAEASDHDENQGEYGEEFEPEPEDEPTLEVVPKPPPPPPHQKPRRADSVDWKRWEISVAPARPAPGVTSEGPSPTSRDTLPTFDAPAVLAALGAQSTIGSQLSVLRRELAGFSGSSLSTLRQVVDAFPDGWARRRAIAALLEAGIPSHPSEALGLVRCLAREFDRRWCLGILARRGCLRGGLLVQALEMVTSPAGRRRIEAVARA
jgi:hypothetical protein